MLTEGDFAVAATELGCEIAAVKAVCEVEAPKGGFREDGTIVTLFEGHIFSKFTKHAYDNSYPDISYANWTTKFYGGPKTEALRLAKAIKLNSTAALMSASWGRFQIMGFNHALCGFPTVEEFVENMKYNEGSQLDAFVEYVKHVRLDDELREKRWADFARGYNGPAYLKNSYDTKLMKAYLKHASQIIEEDEDISEN